MRILRSAGYRRMPWKNGGGVTREVAISPAGASMETMDWRISLASVEEDGPFSIFTGVERTLCVVSGAGIQLRVGALAPADLLVTSEPYTFDGAAATHSRLLDGPIEDLNVMSRRERFRHSVWRLEVNETSAIATIAQVLLIYCQRGDVSLLSDTVSEHLNCDDSAIFDQPTDAIIVATTQTSEIIVAEFYRRAE